MKTMLAFLFLALASAADAQQPGSAVAIGGRRELLVDDFLVEVIVYRPSKLILVVLGIVG